MARKAHITKYPELDYVLLSLIQAHPAISGYQLRAIINESTGYFFHAHLSQIYPSLKRLSKDGLVTFTVVPREGKPDLKLYSITEAGADVVHEWLVKPYEFQTTRANSDRYFLKLVLMGYLAPEEIEAYIDRGIEAFTEQADRIAQNNLDLEMSFIEEADEETRKRYRIIWDNELEFMTRETRTRIKWLEGLKKSLREGE